MPIDQNVKFLGVTDQAISLIERKSARRSTDTEYFSASDIIGLINVVDPEAPEEGTTYYARLATSASLRDCSYDNGTAGVGATLTGSINSGLSQSNQVNKIDNVSPELGDVVLVKNQELSLQNGLYEVTQLGSGSEPFILTRIDGYNETDETYPSIIFISAGSSNANRYFSQTTVDPVIGTDNLSYSISSIGATPILPTVFMDTSTSAALPACTYADGSSVPTVPGFGATLTANALGALGTINGVSMTSDRRIVVKDQVNAAHNGTYLVTDAGSDTRRWQLTRIHYNSTLFYRSREFVVSNINSTLFGDRYTVSSPLSMLNSAFGTTNIVFTKNVSSANIYNSNGTLTGNRTVSGGGFSLTFTGQSAFNIISPSASSLDTAFAVRNNADTRYLFQVDGAGNVFSRGKNNGARDTVYGENAGYNMGVSAYYNTFYGYEAGREISGAACVAIGESCMLNDSTFSTAVGSTAMFGGASYSVAVGVRASRLANNNYSTIIGADAAYFLSNSQKNIILGWSSASAMTGGSNNIILGNYNNALPSTLVTANKNVLIGDEQSDFPATMTGSVVLGYRAKATANNQFSVGSSTENAGAVTTEGFTQALTWTVKINGVDYKIPLQLA